ncbi:MAG: ribonuclease E/G, partial [Candidatus Omnitrophica bacterium]|nr:ribonuclease E/G [Candidatus Omnitrophota bacterium]
MSREILIQTQKGECLVAILENGRVEDFHIELDHYQSLLGNICKGRVESILPSINAAFVNIGQARNGFLYLTDVVTPLSPEDASVPRKILNRFFKKKPAEAGQEAPQGSGHDRRDKHRRRHEPALKVGQEILVQVVKDPFAEKGARLTTHLTLPGRFVVYMPYDKQTGVSKKIENVQERQRLKDVARDFAFAKVGGFIIRTASLKQGKGELVRDAKFLYDMWLKIHKKAEQQKAPALIYEEGELTWRIVRDYLTDDVDKLVIDNREEYARIQKFVETLIGRHMVNKIHHYNGHIPLFDPRNVSKE